MSLSWSSLWTSRTAATRSAGLGSFPLDPAGGTGQSERVEKTSPVPLPPVLFEDEALVAFDKPAGLLSAPDRWDKEETHLVRLAQERFGPETFNVHRLDYETTGVILFAKTRGALTGAARQFAEGKARKRYLALTRGSPEKEEMVVDRPISTDPGCPGKMRMSHRYGRPAVTRLHLLTRWRGYSLVEAFPETGRTHQVRVHLSAVGSPIVADPLYGDGQPLLLSKLKAKYKFKEGREERPLLARVALHAESLELQHPVTGAMLRIVAPLPKDFEVSVRYLRRFAGL